MGFIKTSESLCANSSTWRLPTPDRPKIVGAYFEPSSTVIKLLFTKADSPLILGSGEQPKGVSLGLLRDEIPCLTVFVGYGEGKLRAAKRDLICLDSTGKPWIRTQSGQVPWQGNITLEGGFPEENWSTYLTTALPVISLVSKVVGWEASIPYDQMTAFGIFFRLMPGAKGRIIWATDLIRSKAYFFTELVPQTTFGTSHFALLDRKGPQVNTMQLVTRSLIQNMADKLLLLGIFLATGLLTQIMIFITTWNSQLSIDDYLNERLKMIKLRQGQNVGWKDRVASCAFYYLKFIRWAETKVGIFRFPSLVHSLRLEILIFGLINVAQSPSADTYELLGYLLSAIFISYFMVECLIVHNFWKRVEHVYEELLELKFQLSSTGNYMTASDSMNDPIDERSKNAELRVTEAADLVETEKRADVKQEPTDSSPPIPEASLALLRKSLETSQFKQSPWGFALPFLGSVTKDLPPALPSSNFLLLFLIDIILSALSVFPLPDTPLSSGSISYTIMFYIGLFLARYWWQPSSSSKQTFCDKFLSVVFTVPSVVCLASIFTGELLFAPTADSFQYEWFVEELIFWTYVCSVGVTIIRVLVVIARNLRCTDEDEHATQSLAMGVSTSNRVKYNQIVPQKHQTAPVEFNDRPRNTDSTQFQEGTDVNHSHYVVRERSPDVQRPTHLLRMKLPPAILQPVRGIQELDWNEAFKGTIMSNGSNLEQMLGMRNIASLKSLNSEGRLPRLPSRGSLLSKGFGTEGSRSMRDEFDVLGLGTLDSKLTYPIRQQAINWQELYKNPKVYQKWREYQEKLKNRLVEE